VPIGIPQNDPPQLGAAIGAILAFLIGFAILISPFVWLHYEGEYQRQRHDEELRKADQERRKLYWNLPMGSRPQ